MFFVYPFSHSSLSIFSLSAVGQKATWVKWVCICPPKEILSNAFKHSEGGDIPGFSP